ncbi:MAG TPA: hypothetical protein VKP65_13150 [Rhodothermales bacterium]|nr:hypothetical protein [Rhodothermales bacterium]
MDREKLARELLESEKAVAVGWCGAEAHPLVALRKLREEMCGAEGDEYELTLTGLVKWTPNFGPEAKVVSKACSERKDEQDEEDTEEVQPSV